MNSKPDINNELKFPELMKGKKVELFHCQTCGYHPHVLITGFHQYNSNPLYSKIVRIYPQWTEIVETIVHETCSDDFEIFETLTCCNCGKHGTMSSIPSEFLQSCGLLHEMDESNTVEIQSQRSNWFKSIIRLIEKKLRIS